MAPLSSLLHLLSHSLHAAVGWMGTTLLALFVGAIQYYIVPRVEAWLAGQSYRKPETRRLLTAALIVTVATWLILFVVGVVSTVYRDHVNYRAQNAELRIKAQEQGDEIRQLQEQLKKLTVEPEAPNSLRKQILQIADDIEKFNKEADSQWQAEHPGFSCPLDDITSAADKACFARMDQYIEWAGAFTRPKPIA